MKSVDFVTNIAPHYRRALWAKLLKIPSYRVRFFFGIEQSSTIKQIDFSRTPWSNYSDRLIRLGNVRFGQVLVWQYGVLGNATRTNSDIVIFLGDMYVVSTWIAVLILRLRGRKIVFWGHGLYGNEGAFKKLLRVVFLRMADINLVYGERSRKLLVEIGFGPEAVRVIFNSLDYDLQKSLRQKVVQERFFSETGWFLKRDQPTLIYIGRLAERKRLDMLIMAVNELNSGGPKTNLLIIGAGPERQKLETLVPKGSKSIHFYGPCYDENELATLIANADLCVSPGEIGLPAIHAMSYGTPACSHNNLSMQGPEAEAIIEGVTGTFFDGSASDLRKRIELWFENAHNRESVRADCYQLIDEKYNPDVQCRILNGALNCL